MTSSHGSLSKTPRAKPAVVVQAIFVQQASTICVIPSRGAITIQIYPTQIPMSYRMKSSSKSFLHFEQGKELLFPRQRKRGGEKPCTSTFRRQYFPEIQRSIKPRRSPTSKPPNANIKQILGNGNTPLMYFGFQGIMHRLDLPKVYRRLRHLHELMTGNQFLKHLISFFRKGNTGHTGNESNSRQ